MQSDICVLAPDNIVAEQVESLRSALHRPISLLRCHVDNCITVARSALERGARVVVARGSMAARIRQSGLDLAVIELAIAGYDLIDTMRRAREFDSRVALVGFDNVLVGSDLVAKALGIKLFTARVFSVADSATGVEQAFAEGYRVIIGGRRVVERAEKLGMTALPLYANLDNVRAALLEAERMAGVLEKQREAAARLSVTLDSIRDAIISFTMDGEIIFFNRQADRWFQLSRPHTGGAPGFVAQSGLGTAAREGLAWNAEVLPWEGSHFACTLTPVVSDMRTSGWVAVLQSASHVESMEHKMRSKLHARGHTATYSLRDIVHAAAATRELVETARFYAHSPSTVLIEGESGSGKELFAQGIHSDSPRRRGPFVAVNCAAIPESLMESELFGYEEGAFTGARKGGKAGLFEVAHSGTLFLDEIGDMPLRLQSFLLRVLEEKTVTRLGQSVNIPVDVRIICAVNKDLQALVAKGAFRADLYYRLNVLRLRIPPLRERPDDIAALLVHFFSAIPSSLGRARVELGDDAMALLAAYSYPGNIREMRNLVERLIVTDRKGIITEADVLAQLPSSRQYGGGVTSAVSPHPGLSGAPRPDSALDIPPSLPKGLLGRQEENLIRATLASCNGNKAETARRLGISPATLWRKLKSMAP